MSRATYLVIVPFLLAIAALAACSPQSSAPTSSPTATADSFMAGLRDDKFSDAYSVCSPALQQELKNVQALTAMVENGKVKPVKWTFDKQDVTNDTAGVQGTVTYTDNRQAAVRLELHNLGGDWKVSGFHLRQS
jgi:hypothetical protein